MTSLLLEWFKVLGLPRITFVVLLLLLLVWAAPSLVINSVNSLDHQLLDVFIQHIPSGLGSFLVVIYKLSGVHVTGVLVLAVLFFFALKRFWQDLICLVFGTGGILVIVDQILKPWFDRPRPGGSLLSLTGRSFPSGHAAGSVVFYFMSCTMIAAHYPRLRWPLFVFSSLWVALVWSSTLYSRAHWPSDILAGAAVGYVWLTFCLAGFTVWERNHLFSSQRSSQG